MYSLKALTTFSLILFTSIVTARVSVQVHVESGQDVLEPVPQQNEHIQSLSWRDCSSGSQDFQLSGFSMNPDPPVTAKSATLTINGTTSTPIQEGAYAEVTVKIGLVTILHRTIDICEELRLSNVSNCPLSLQKGDGVPFRVDLGAIPPARYSFEINTYTVDDDDLMCVVGNVFVV